MISKLFIQLIKYKLITGIVLLVIVGGGYFSYAKIFNNDGVVRYATAQVQKGTLIVSISGNGQIDVSDRIDLKPEVSGKITAVYVAKGQEVKKGSLLASIDSRNAERAVSDAEISLESAKIRLEELLRGTDAQSMLQAENALAQAERNLEKAQLTYDNIDDDTERTLADAYESGYNDVSTSFFKLSGYVKDLQDVLGTEKSENEHIVSYKVFLGQDSPFIQKLLDNFYRAQNLYNKNFAFFREVSRDDDRDNVYKLINDTLETTKAIAQTFESARHMYDAIVARSYTQYFISSTIDKMKPKIESDLSSIFSTITSLERTIDTIDTTIQDTPGKIKDAEISLASAKESVESRRLALEELKTGVDRLDIRTQQNTVAQKEAALWDSEEKLAGHFIRAPFDGVIGEINIKTGDSVSSGTTLATLMAKQYIAALTLNEIDVAKVKLNQPVTLTFDAVDGLTLTGKVTDIASTASTNQGVVTYGIAITLDTMDELIKSGMTVTAAIVTEAKPDVLLVPNSAVKSQGGMSYVEVPDESDASVAIANINSAIFKNPIRQQQVEIGPSNDEFVEIISGLKEGDVIVIKTIQPTIIQTTQTNQNSSISIPGLNTGGGQIRMR